MSQLQCCFSKNITTLCRRLLIDIILQWRRDLKTASFRRRMSNRFGDVKQFIFTSLSYKSWDVLRKSHQRSSAMKVLLKISQNSLKISSARFSILIKLQTWGLRHRCFLVNFAKVLGAPFLQNTFERLLQLWLKVMCLEIVLQEPSFVSL